MSASNDYNDPGAETIAQGSDTVDNSYTSRPGQDGGIPVVKDETPIDNPNDRGNPDSDEALARDDREAIDDSNILDGDRTRHAKPSGSYNEPGDEEGLPGPDDGRSAVAQ